MVRRQAQRGSSVRPRHSVIKHSEPDRTTPVLSFHGAAQGVTGSCHLLEAAGRSILVDCGLYQGGRASTLENEAPFGFDPAAIDYVLLTHAHLDHCGRLPLLVKHGFRGEIIATPATRELARLILLDCAHLEEEDARRARKRPQRRAHPAPEPLYTVADAMWSFDRFGRTAEYDRSLALEGGLTVRFIDAGHILGSAAVEVELDADGPRRRILFSGDQGGPGHPILRDPSLPRAADFVVIESTYGDRRHRPLAESVDELYAAILDTLRRGGNVVIPAFALERSQELLYYLHDGVRRGILPQRLPVFLDSPMAISATEIMRRHPECFDDEMRERLAQDDDPFALPGLRFMRDPAESMALNRIAGGAVIMAGSGMCTGGRVRHHLRQNLGRQQSSVIFVGFAAPGTLARQIIDGADAIQMFDETIPVRARIHTINSFSAHADQGELVAWHAAAGRPEMTYLVHGDPDRGMAGLAAALRERGHAVLLPRLHEQSRLGAPVTLEPYRNLAIA
jgi:metallo-beta-lactamase family protein